MSFARYEHTGELTAEDIGIDKEVFEHAGFGETVQIGCIFDRNGIFVCNVCSKEHARLVLKKMFRNGQVTEEDVGMIEHQLAKCEKLKDNFSSFRGNNISAVLLTTESCVPEIMSKWMARITLDKQIEAETVHMSRRVELMLQIDESELPETIADMIYDSDEKVVRIKSESGDISPIVASLEHADILLAQAIALKIISADSAQTIKNGIEKLGILPQFSSSIEYFTETPEEPAHFILIIPNKSKYAKLASQVMIDRMFKACAQLNLLSETRIAEMRKTTEAHPPLPKTRAGIVECEAQDGEEKHWHVLDSNGDDCGICVFSSAQMLAVIDYLRGKEAITQEICVPEILRQAGQIKDIKERHESDEYKIGLIQLKSVTERLMCIL